MMGVPDQRDVKKWTGRRALGSVGAAACWWTGLKLAPDVTGNRQHNHFSHKDSPLANQCEKSGRPERILLI
jgi:hypothetical protein